MNEDTGSEVPVTSARTAVHGGARIQIWALRLQAAKAEAWSLDGFPECSLCFALSLSGSAVGNFQASHAGLSADLPLGWALLPAVPTRGTWPADLRGWVSGQSHGAGEPAGPQPASCSPGTAPGPPADATCQVRKRRVVSCTEGQESIDSGLACIRR